MRNLFHKILSALNFKGRDWVVFLLALLLAFSIWLIHNLSFKYDEYLTVNVTASCPSLEGHAPKSSNSESVTAHCRATGYNVISSKWRGRHRVKKLSIKDSELHRKSDEVYYVLSKDLHNYISNLYGDGVSVDYFVTDTLFFRFPLEQFKKVPVVAEAYVYYRAQYMSKDGLALSPDSVVIYGDPYMLARIESVLTSPIRYSDLHQDVQGLARIDKVKGVRMSHSEVRYSLDVNRYVEVRRNLPVEIRNLPDGKRMSLFPATVEVSLKCAFPLMEDPFDKMNAYVDYAEYQSSLSGKCRVCLTSIANSIYSYETEPHSVTCIVEDIL